MRRGFSYTTAICVPSKDCAKFDFQTLLHAMADDVAAQRAEVAGPGFRIEGLGFRV